jgi:hypothetical protein
MPAASSRSIASRRLNQAAKAIGCPELIHLDSPANPRQLEYLDLLPGRAPTLPQAVAEFQGRPILYLLAGVEDNGQPRTTTNQIADLQHLLANRSEHACLAVVKPGQLDIYPINLDRKKIEEVAPEIITIADPDAPIFFQSIATGSRLLRGQPSSSDYVFDEIHRLLAKASDALTGALKPLDVLSITGRALFYRFLLDRRIVDVGEIDEICPQAANGDLRDVFSSPDKAAATSAWLDDTFNGDLLPLVPGLTYETSSESRRREYRRFFRAAGKATNSKVFLHLQAILCGWEAVGADQFQLPLAVDWDDLNFAHIPVGVLSQVYETFSHQWDEVQAEATGVHYTPKNIARLLVEEALAGVKNPAEARVLDPTCGAGVFLVLAFRQLVRKQWEHNKERPNKDAIHRILYNQLYGFDVSESALRLAALALYVTAIELNGTTRPPKLLKVPHALKDRVLFNFGPADGADRRHGFVFGSLSADVPAKFDGTFDAVVGNPPWTRLRPTADDTKQKAEQVARNEALDQNFTAIGRRVLAARGLEALGRNYTNPDKDPDIPFIWRAMEWAKPGGIIALVLPCRLILKQSGPGKAARDALFMSLTVTGILNGSDLEKTSVWPKMDLPFLLLFSRNTVPPTDHHFHFITPLREDPLADRGDFRIDYQSAQPVSVRAIIEKPWLLKTLGVGTALDVEVNERLNRSKFQPLSHTWGQLSLRSGVGYKIAANLKQEDADDLFDLLDFEPPESGFRIAFESLTKWKTVHQRKTVHSTGPSVLYRAPLIIIPQTPGEDPSCPKAYLSKRRRLCFSQSYYGYSAVGHPDGEVLISLLYLITHSTLFRHFCLMRSSRIGASYRTFIKQDLDAFPFPEPAKLTVAQKRRIVALAEALETALVQPRDELDDFIFRLYGLDEDDATVVRDTVSFNGPYRSVRKFAEQAPSQQEIKVFCDYLEEMLQPFFEVAEQRLIVAALPRSTNAISPWRFLTLGLADREVSVAPVLIGRIMQEANRTAASRVVMTLPDGALLVGLLNRRRFWTRSRARLCGLHISRERLDVFPLPPKA